MTFFNKKNILFIFLFLIIFLLIAIMRFESEIKTQNITVISDKLSVTLRSQLEREKEDALRFALVLAQNEAIINALETDDEDRAHDVLSSIMENVEKHTHTLIRSQIITSDYFIFARSWDNIYAGMPLDEYRSDLDYFKNNKNPRVSIEVGRRLGIKATIPVYKSRKLLGYVEVLQFFDATTAFFKELGIDFYVLMDYDYYNTAVLMQNNPTAGIYIIANRSYNNIHLKTLDRLDFKKLRHDHVVLSDDRYIFFEPMNNAEGKQIGAFVMVAPKTEIDNFATHKEDLSIFISFSRKDLYDIVKKEYLDTQLYKSQYDKALLYLKDTVADEDKDLYMQEAQDILQSYSKEELIALILKHKNVKRIEGKIQ